MSLPTNFLPFSASSLYLFVPSLTLWYGRYTQGLRCGLELFRHLPLRKNLQDIAVTSMVGYTRI